MHFTRQSSPLFPSSYSLCLIGLGEIQEHNFCYDRRHMIKNQNQTRPKSARQVMEMDLEAATQAWKCHSLFPSHQPALFPFSQSLSRRRWLTNAVKRPLSERARVLMDGHEHGRVAFAVLLLVVPGESRPKLTEINTRLMSGKQLTCHPHRNDCVSDSNDSHCCGYPFPFTFPFRFPLPNGELRDRAGSCVYLMTFMCLVCHLSAYLSCHKAIWLKRKRRRATPKANQLTLRPGRDLFSN